MPKISAATVAEHRAQVEAQLLDAAETLLRAGHPLTAGEVSKAAGIARNSIYRYVDSVDDLRGLVVSRHLPAWQHAVDEALAGVTDPGERITTWLRANLEQAATTGHGWLMAVAQGADLPPEAVDAAHHLMRRTLADAWGSLTDPPPASIYAALTVGLLDAAFGQLDAGAPAEVVIELTVRAGAALVAAAA